MFGCARAIVLSAWACGFRGIRSENGLESAIAQPLNVYFYGSRTSTWYEGMAAIPRIAESQAYLDGNKRTGIGAALVFLDLNGQDDYTASGKNMKVLRGEAMIKVAKGSA